MTSDIKKLHLFDANCMLGRIIAPKEGFPATVEELLKVMDDFEIAEALVYSSLSKEYHPADGNRILLDEIADVGRLHAMWVVMPSHTGEFPSEEELVAEMLSKNVRAARVFPGPDRHNFSLKQWCSGKLLRALQNKAVPLFIDLDDFQWDTVHELCDGYPKLPLVLTNVGYRSDRFLYPLLEKFDNLHVELSNYCAHGAIATLAERFGAQQLLFGTRLPYFTPAATVAMLNYADIKEADKRLIGGENLRNLLKKVGN